MGRLDFEEIDSYITACLDEAKKGKSKPFYKKLSGNIFTNLSPTVPPMPRYTKDKNILEDAAKFISTHFQRANFTDILRSYIRQRNMTNPQVYTAAGMTADCFSKIISGKTKKPGKDKILALSIALQLELDEASELFESAGIALSKAKTEDILYIYSLEKRLTLDETNEVLCHYDCALLGGVE